MTSKEETFKKIFIAYKNKDSTGFGSLPYLLDEFDTIDEARWKKQQMEIEGYVDVVVFELVDKHLEEISWDYVYKHKIK